MKVCDLWSHGGATGGIKWNQHNRYQKHIKFIIVTMNGDRTTKFTPNMRQANVQILCNFE